MPLGVALIVAGSFEPVTAVDAICNDFMAQAQVPLALLQVETLLGLIRALRDDPPLRPKLRWRHVFVRTGLVPSKLVDDELTSARNESWSRELSTDRGNIC